MSEFLSNPAVQSGIIPFIVSLITAIVIRNRFPIWGGLVVVLGFYTSVYLTSGFQFLPFTSTRKIVLLGLLAFIAGLILDRVSLLSKYNNALLLIATACAILWMIWPVASRKDGLDLLIFTLPAIALAVWYMGTIIRLNNSPVSASVTTLMISMGTGGSALISSSALLGQYGIALGSSIAAIIVVFILQGKHRLNYEFTVPLALLSALIGVAAVVYSDLPWYSLLPLALIPIVVSKVNFSKLSTVKLVLYQSILTGPFAGIAILLTYNVSGSLPF